jgi:hypothetical protein
MIEVASTYTLRPSISKALSIMPALASNCIERETGGAVPYYADAQTGQHRILPAPFFP